MTREQLNNITREDAEKIIELAREKGCETFSDISEMCADLRNLCKASLIVCENDDVAKSNLNTLVSLLDVCSTLAIDCDDYYRNI